MREALRMAVRNFVLGIVHLFVYSHKHPVQNSVKKV